MKLGVNVPHYGPGTSPESLAGWVQFAEATGFSTATLSDHIALTPDVAAYYPEPFYDPFTTLAWLAGQTESIELGTSVIIVPYRSPLLTTRMGAGIDRLSGGRFVLGLGVGWSEPEFAALDVEFDRRGAIADEYLSATLQLWTTPTATFHGRFVSFEAVTTGPDTVREPHPPLWVGGSSPAAIARTARIADAWHPIVPPLAWLRGPACRRSAGPPRKQVGGCRPCAHGSNSTSVRSTTKIRTATSASAACPRYSTASAHWRTWVPSTWSSTPARDRTIIGRPATTGGCWRPWRSGPRPGPDAGRWPRVRPSGLPGISPRGRGG